MFVTKRQELGDDLFRVSSHFKLRQRAIAFIVSHQLINSHPHPSQRFTKDMVGDPHPLTIFATILDRQEEWGYFSVETLRQDLKLCIEWFSGVWKNTRF